MTMPVTIISGFLGAGKTTLLNRILADPQGVRYGVLVNDFGAINIDAALIKEAAPDRISLANGCVCCTIRGDLIAAAMELSRMEPRPDQIVVETSGVSNPIAVAEAFFSELSQKAFRVESVFCLLEAASFPDLDFASSELAIDQARRRRHRPPQQVRSRRRNSAVRDRGNCAARCQRCASFARCRRTSHVLC